MLEKPSKQRAVLLGAAIIAAISGIPGLNLINCCCCAGIIVGGMMSVYFYLQDFRVDSAPLETSDALVVGLLSGLLGAVAATVMTTMFSFVLGPLESELMGKFYEKMIDRLVDGGSLPADLADQLRDQMDKSLADAVTFGGIVLNLFLSIILYPVFGMLGGLIGYGIFRKKSTPAPQQ
ncbi:MAG TPA: hypothetical protein DCX46_13090 [Bacteroidetes bacterium]|nr:hypothetical protein [Bacteroidota bacterium]